ncbi:MAG: 1-acyl-sn-glycerol-3-phosphate acyltransferase [Leptolyngbyaceae cyanobacterium SL_5_9]|nr:1-acyl-sn-glycerol-3-phosphate acyltransferase [Leptolyngbyaceae cyanobacterium SL_5_9]NJO75025.1 1-acyl-sn-glycerol-3-phosphate acyltransferase [Leptolyngbyaceae cyanobacterium RM1_406_9]
MTVKTVQPPLEFIPPTYNSWVVNGVQHLLPLWLSYRNGISHVQTDHLDRLVNMYEQFQSGKTRFLIAFRHPTLDDPPCLYYLLSHLVQSQATRKNIKLRYPIHAHFLYDRGIPLWAGPAAGWLLARMGATPIQRGKVDLVGLRSARHLFAKGSFPLAAAPEGSINCQSERLNPLEPGIAQLGFWCVEDLLQEGRPEQVMILPIGIQYHYVHTPWRTLNALLSQMEAECGLSDTQHWKSQKPQSQEAELCQRLLHLMEHLLSLLEEFYNRFFHQPLSGIGSIDDRLQTLVKAALSLAEQGFGLQAKGDLLERRHHIEQAGWNWTYRKDLPNPTHLLPVEYGLANYAVELSNLNMWHMRLAETLLAISTRYVQEKPNIERLSETTLLVWQAIAHLKGTHSTSKRPYLGRRQAHISIGNALSVSDRWDAYRTNRRQAVTNLTQDLQQALENMLPTVFPTSQVTPLAS